MVLFATPDLDERELEVVERIEELKRTLRFRLREPRRWYGSLRRLSFARAIQGSNSIEGYNAELDDAAAAADGAEPLDADEKTRFALDGYRDAMTYVLQLANDSTFEYSPQLFKSLHFMMMKHELHKRPGQWRLGPVYVENTATKDILYEGPDALLVPELVDQLCQSLQGDAGELPVVRAGMAHLNFVMIHPFKDGNGRMSRCLQTLVLAREGIVDPTFSSIEEYLGRNTDDYYSVLAQVGAGRWQPERDAKQWLRFTLTAHLRQARTMLQRVKESEELWSTLETITAEHGLPDRVIPALFDAALALRIRNVTYRSVQPEEAPISDQVASNDLAKLTKLGLLSARGASRGRYYVATPELRKHWEDLRKLRDPRDDSDPFAQD